MKLLAATMLFGLSFMGGTYAQDIGQPGTPAVRQAHDRWPGIVRWHDSKDDNECKEMHNLKPDGDNDCDDVTPTPFSIPEPGTLALLLTGLGGLAIARYRHRR